MNEMPLLLSKSTAAKVLRIWSRVMVRSCVPKKRRNSTSLSSDALLSLPFASSDAAILRNTSLCASTSSNLPSNSAMYWRVAVRPSALARVAHLHCKKKAVSEKKGAGAARDRTGSGRTCTGCRWSSC